jgi:putative ABC transport system ATP-binding protein
MDHDAVAASSADPIVSFSDVTFGWGRDGPTVLDIERFHVAKAERLFLRGPSGSGKTSLLNLIGGVATPRSGRITILGVAITGLTGSRRDRFRADHIGFIFQQFNLVPYLGLIENVVLPCRFSRRRAQRAIDRSGSLEAEARRLLDRMNIGAAALASGSVSKLSVGQQQRVAAARSLIGSPELVIADEPTSSIDDDARQAFLALLLEEARGFETTLIFVSHDERLAGHFDRALALSDINTAGQGE